jgi:ribosomal protein S12 methylthiotransferase accessory factor
VTFRDIVNPRVGLVRSTQRLGRGSLEPTPPYIAQATLAHFDYRKASHAVRTGTGRGATEEEAMLTAIGEAMERYCAAQPPRSTFVRSSYEAVRTNAIPPADFGLYSQRQYEQREVVFPRWDPSLEISWVWAQRLADRGRVLVPTSLVYLDYVGNYEETYFCAGTSNGLAAGATLEAAVVSGLLELLERDAYLTTWLHRLPAREIVLQAVEERTRQVVECYRRHGVVARAFLLKSEFSAHTVLAALIGSPDGPAVVTGLGCGLDVHEALWRAVSEASQGHPGLVARCVETNYAPHLKCYEDVRELEDHAAFFFPSERLRELDFLLKGSERFQLDSPLAPVDPKPEQLSRLVDDIVRSGYEPLFVDLTTPDLVDFPIRVVRVLVAGLQPMHFGFGQERLGCERLYRVPRLLGLSDRPVDEAELNRCPHPLG